LDGNTETHNGITLSHSEKKSGIGEKSFALRASVSYIRYREVGGVRLALP
jgi:hypothetical protein